MKVMLLAFATAVVIAVLADLALNRAGFSVQDVTTGQAVRVE